MKNRAMINFLAFVVFVSLLSAFLLTLAWKWGWIEWLQVHAPNEFFNKLFSCKFCCSFHMGVVISLIISVVSGNWFLLAVPVCSSVIASKLW